MQSFLDRLIEECFPEKENDFSDYCVIFPTRRSGLIFKNKLIQKTRKAFRLPEVYAVNDFIASLSPLRIAERIELLFELYTVYKEYFKHTPYDVFAPWGEMMLKDFDETDKYLADAHLLFKSIESVKEIEDAFQFDEEILEDLKFFWQSFSEKEMSEAKKKFINTWKILSPLYINYTAALKNKGMSYEGMVYRELAVNPEAYFSNLKNKQIIVAGFYALTPAEESIFNWMQNNLNQKIFWDADIYYADNKVHEAGSFIRKNSFTKNNFRWKGDYFNERKTITITGVPQQTAQAKALGAALLKNKTGEPEEECVIVLPDEGMLEPVLNSLPHSVEHLNITMGLPVKQTKVFSLLLLWHKLYETRKTEKDNLLLHTPTLTALCRHPLIFGHISHETTNRLKSTTNNYIYFNRIPGISNNVLSRLVQFPASFDETFSSVAKILQGIKEITAVSANHHVTDFEMLSFVLNEFIGLQKIIKPYKGFTTVKEAWMVIKDFVGSLKIPFSGEPVKGIQLMGFLETRVLDFKNVYILNLNENVLPPDNLRSSFIPFTIRKSFGLPVLEDNDAITSYHFYRLLQRAQNIFLFYCTETNATNGGEMSRFLLQLFFELKIKMQEKLKINHIVASGPAALHVQVPIEIKPTDDLINKVHSLFDSVKEENKKGFTPSTLSTYINCSLQFYFKHIVKIKEPDTIEEEIEDGTFGQILHKAMETIYESYKGTEVTEKELKNIDDKKINAVVRHAIKEKYDPDFVASGKNFLVEKTLIALIKKIISEDISYSPFVYEASERGYSYIYQRGNKPGILFNGIFDRIDRQGNSIRIVDYKTGRAEVKSFKEPETLFTSSDFKVNFQLMFYVWLAAKNGLSKNITAAIYPLKQMSGGALYLSQAELSETVQAEFEELLIKMTSEILNNPHFRQTDDLRKCSVCPYKVICNR